MGTVKHLKSSTTDMSGGGSKSSKTSAVSKAVVLKNRFHHTMPRKPTAVITEDQNSGRTSQPSPSRKIESNEISLTDQFAMHLEDDGNDKSRGDNPAK